MRRRSLGPAVLVQREGAHGRRRGKRLSIRQAHERARSLRQLQAETLRELSDQRVADGMMGFVAPVMTDGRTVR